MLPYSRQLKQNSRELRSHMTDAEQKLWYRLRRKQINGWQFYRQKPLGPYIVDFYCPEARLVIELDGSQHLEPQHQAADRQRDAYLSGLGLLVLRFDNRQALLELDAVMDAIAKSPPSPPFSKGGVNRRTRETPAIEPDSAPLAIPTKEKAATPESPFEKGATPSIPPFEKGGLGGICLEASINTEPKA